MDTPANPVPPTPDEPDKPSQLDQLAKRLEEFKQQVAQNRDQIRNKAEEYTPIVVDEEYELLRQNSMFLLDDDFRNLSHYPFHTTLRQREQRERTEDPEYPTVDFDQIPKKVYRLKAFEEPEEPPTEPVTPAVNPRRNRLLSERARLRAIEALKRNRQDLEQYLYENVIGKIGVLVLTIGLAILVRHGINIGMLGEVERVLVGIASAGLLFYLGYLNTVKNETMSVLYSAAGLAILYYTSYLSYSAYGFLPQFGAFAFKIAITGVAIFLAFYYDHRFFALLALLGIYLTPFIIQADELNYGLFFSYLLVMNVAMIAVGYYKQWQSVDDLTFITTVLIFGTWMRLMRGQWADEQIFVTGVLFATLFFLLFFLMFIFHSFRRVTDEGEVALSERDYWLFVINDLLYFAVIYLFLDAGYLRQSYLGWFMLGFGTFNALYAWILFRSPHRDAKLLRYLMVVALIATTVAAPFLFRSMAWRHAYWLAEAVLLTWLAQAGRVQLLRDFSALTLALALAVLAGIWHKVYWAGTYAFLFNPAGQATVLTIGGLAGCILLLLRREKTEMVLTFTVEGYLGLLGGLGLLLFYAVGNVELYKHNIFNREYQRLLIGIYNSVFALALGVVSERLHVTVLKKIALWSIVAAIFSYVLVVHQGVVDLRDLFLVGRAPLYTFVTHYLNLALALACLFTLGYSRYHQLRGQEQAPWDLGLWVVGVGVVFHATAEFDHHMVLFLQGPGMATSTILNNNRLFGYTLLWPLCAFAFLLVGTRYQLKDLRLFSLGLIGATLLKFIVHDFWRIDVMGKVLSALFIGSLLLLVSYLSRQLRELVLAGNLDVMGQVVAKLAGKVRPRGPRPPEPEPTNEPPPETGQPPG
jgi:hypothetical protein